jgi:hypothetical protein
MDNCIQFWDGIIHCLDSWRPPKHYKESATAHAVTQGDVEAIVSQWNICENDNNPPEDDFTRGLMDKLFNKIHCGNVEAWQYVLRIADKGNHMARSLVAVCYAVDDEMSHIEKDPSKSTTYGKGCVTFLRNESKKGSICARGLLELFSRYNIVPNVTCFWDPWQLSSSFTCRALEIRPLIFDSKCAHTKLLLEAAKAGMAGAQYNYGQSLIAYANGELPKNDEDQYCREGWEWVQKAANQGYVRAIFELLKRDRLITPLRKLKAQLDTILVIASGWVYLEAAMLVTDALYSRDAVQGALWFQVAAERGNNMAAIMLGLCHWKGYGVPKCRLRAHELLSSYFSRMHINLVLLLCTSLLPYCKEYSEFRAFLFKSVQGT